MTKPIEIGQQVPDFTLPASTGGDISLSQYLGRKVLLYFYPKNMTPACTQEACEFRDAHDEISARGAVLLGISPDSLASHGKFTEKNSLPFPLLSDEEHRVSEMFGVWQLKKLYGKEFMGIVRSTFLIDEQGKLAAEWRKIRVKGHVEMTLEELAK
ncbi:MULTISPECIES: thioredoxin-dependent thiol peroxidase [unclassified Paenibacillus]|uniref:thioredoxin-dependent thiol peroxidase n=1 Tax=unclassified Paenibacillus TaxID=185978 RepID=UPI0024061200|nr:MULTISPECIES: thioredoxin-dependent thiol peroxidase [unclassified Paenibacillus]MDF9844712.1 peroxiredoxin Q/BCP [Paenibacillus sp. PastF-2]MDF9851314.1 peroxiredoxin Q/BCP [Paenibacillus sp. PastM-2]MDF9857897.1 peroxiredoxin Q/BCP [Paenibacillus sp. PastF-1]MDH6483163.1 peroxiredoxin Q/BCP [Paenibacillus sp. PastH-2]MDH6510580.1 peroxiredoxin Q/BCP [Paenibacillus sp. PastM-3]